MRKNCTSGSVRGCRATGIPSAKKDEIPLNYDALDTSYWAAQKDRIEQLRKNIASRPKIGDGRVVPEDESLSIGDGRRLSMAVMYLDICEFSSRGMATLEDQDLMLRVLNLYFTEMIRIAEEYGGNVEKNTGDGLLIYFNDGEGMPTELGPKRAVACALTMFATTKHLINPIVVVSGVKQIDFRISIDYGQVTIARIGAPKRFNANTAIGNTANFASKMLRFAKAGEIVLGESAKHCLPFDWQIRWTTPVVEPTGWLNIEDNSPYILYRYIGRWSNLT
jgi:adenylate cyclase